MDRSAPTLQTLPNGLEPLLLVVGEFSSQPPRLHLKAMSRTETVDFAQLDTALKVVYPDIVISILVSQSFDAMDVAEILASHKYDGKYRILVNPVPNAALIVDDIRAAAPMLDVDLLVIDAD